VFNVGGGELIVIMLIALIVLGPERLPDAARQVGKVMGDLRRLSSGFQNEMKTAFAEVDDPTRVAARRNVLAKEEPQLPAGQSEESSGDDTPMGAAVANVSNRPAPVAPPAMKAARSAKKAAPPRTPS